MSTDHVVLQCFETVGPAM